MREPPSRYGSHRRRYYLADGAAAITRRAERRVAAEAPSRTEALLVLADRLRSCLDGEARERWLELEEALHAYWLEVSIAHYDLGVEAGVRRAVGAHFAKLPARTRLEALAQVLAELAGELPD